jgi:MYXO-CTERM domain-containing protein
MFARSPADVGITDNIGGVSPFTANCSVIENSIVFVFTDNLAKKPRLICEVMSQEIAHSYGLDHELVASDPMSYLPYKGNRAFQDEVAPCGESTARACGASGMTCRDNQNSVALLRARLGAANRDNQPPSVSITEPADRTTVSAGFAVTATAVDNIAVAAVTFYVDGEVAATRTAAPYTLETDPALTVGSHTIMVEAADSDGNTATEQHEITIADQVEPLGPGCAAGGKPSAGWLAIAIAALAMRRRRSAS